MKTKQSTKSLLLPSSSLGFSSFFFLKKKAALNFYENWVEYSFFLMLFIGFVLGLVVDSAFLHYLVIFFVGMLVGRLFYLKKKYLPFPRYLVTTGFVLGFLVASFQVNWKGLLLVFFLGSYIGYKIHQKQWLKEFM